MDKDGNGSVLGRIFMGFGFSWIGFEMISHPRFSGSISPWIPYEYPFGIETHEIIYNLLPLDYTCECYIYHVYVYRKYLLLLLCCHTKQI